MRLRRLLVAGAVAAAAVAAPAVARADSSGEFSFYFGGSPGMRGLHVILSTVKLSGAITMDFHGDAAAGCAAAHVCDVNGTVRWAPHGGGSINAFSYRSGKRRFTQASLSIGDLSVDEQPLRTTARVRREGVANSLCADAAPGDSGSGAGSERRGSSAAIRLIRLPSSTSPSNEILRTRCAGPMAADVAALLPARTVGEHALVHGKRTLDFSADGRFSAHGLAGTVHSDIRLRVLGGRRFPFNTSNPGHRRFHRRRAIDVSYRVERVSGEIGLGVTGRADPDLCGPFDACGITGSVTTSLAASSGFAEVSADAPIRVSRRQLRRAVGLARGRPPRGVTADGYASWLRDAGTVVSDLSRNGAPACSDSTPVAGGGSLYFEFPRGHVRASYGTGGLQGEFDIFRTRCPGPSAVDAPDPIAHGTFPLNLLGRRRVTLRLTRGSRFTSAGYSSRLSPDVTVVLRRTSVDEYTYRDEIPPDYAPGHVRSLR
jgi:hypothetical protein